MESYDFKEDDQQACFGVIRLFSYCGGKKRNYLTKADKKEGMVLNHPLSIAYFLNLIWQQR